MSLTLGPVGNVFFFVTDLDAAVTWYTDFLGADADRPMPQLARWDLGHTILTLHAEDEFNTPAPATAGTVPYFTVTDVEAVKQAAERLGATAHRGPKTVFSGETLLQIQDPFGNLIGFRSVAADAPTP